MLSEKEIWKIGGNEIRSIFGIDYLRANQKGSCHAHGFTDDTTYMMFIGLKTKKDLPNHYATQKGWTVYADIRINTNTGEVIKKEFLKE